MTKAQIKPPIESAYMVEVWKDIGDDCYFAQFIVPGKPGISVLGTGETKIDAVRMMAEMIVDWAEEIVT